MSEIPLLYAQDVNPHLSWSAVIDALDAGHRLARAEIGDLLLRHGRNALLNRAAWIDQAGIALKSVTVFPGNPSAQPPRPSVQGVMLLFDDRSGRLLALIDGVLVTYWKTAADSVLGARLLARPDSKRLLIVGAGAVARSLIEAYSEIFPGLERISIWNRTPARAAELAAEFEQAAIPVRCVPDLAVAVAEADMISSATLAQEPFLRGEWVQPGTHVDLIGAFTPNMREADDDLMRTAELFVDSRATTLHEIGELKIPLAAGVISEADVRGDFYDLCNGGPGRSSDSAVTLFKNGGGAHLDLMTGRLMFQLWQQSRD